MTFMVRRHDGRHGDSQRGDRRRGESHGGHLVGLDLGATAVRAAALVVASREGQVEVRAETLGGVLLAPGTVVGGEVIDGAALTASLKTLWRRFDIDTDDVILGVANPQVMVRELSVPDLDRDQMVRALPFQARDVIAMPLDQVVLDFAPLGSVSDETQLVAGLLVATPRAPVISAIKAVEDAGLTVTKVDLSSFAVLRSSADGGFGAEVVIDLGAHLTTIVVHAHGIPRLVRTLSRGGEELTTKLAERLEMTIGSAEDAKRASGLDSPGEVSKILRELIEPLLAEVRSSVNYFRSGQPGSPIDRVALTGHAAELIGLDAALARQLELPVQAVSPTRLLGSGTDERWATALSVGLAMGAAA